MSSCHIKHDHTLDSDCLRKLERKIGCLEGETHCFLKNNPNSPEHSMQAATESSGIQLLVEVMKWKFRVMLLFVFLLCLAVSQASISSDEITSLPGFGVTPTRQYSGYLNVDVANGRNLHYWFVESESNATDVPLLLWLNGGPGCSSLDGFLYEMGPFKFEHPDGDGLLADEDDVPPLVQNPNRWNLQAHMLYLEAPAFVGFSYSGVAFLLF